MKRDRIIFHVDVNSAYLSFTAADMLRRGETNIDITKIPSAIGGDVDSRTGIILAASIPAKNKGISSGQTIYSALKLFPELVIYKPDFNLYVRCNKMLVDLLYQYSPKVQVFSIDECFLDMSHFKDTYMEKAKEIKDRIYKELGFKVNVGISNCKLLAKQASDFKPKDSIHTLFPEEMKNKFWKRPVGELFGVGKATLPKLNRINIYTIGDLANYDVNILRQHLKSYGIKLHEYANGVDNSEVKEDVGVEDNLDIKGIGNSTTLKKDISDIDYIYKVLLALTENTCLRLRERKKLSSLVQVSIKTNDFIVYSHQKTLKEPTDSTNNIYSAIKECINEMWNGNYVRQVGIRLGKLSDGTMVQTSLFGDIEEVNEKTKKIDNVIDELRKKYGKGIIKRSTFLDGDINALEGGTTEEYTPKISSIL